MSFEPAPTGGAVARLIAPNPGPMTLEGTNTYVAGSDPCWVIDPGPDDPIHVEAIRTEGDRRGGIAGVLLTHAHRDHTAGVEMLGAPVAWGKEGDSDELGAFAAAIADAEGPLPPSRPVREARSAPPESHIGPFRVVPTPGHAVDHVCFVLDRVCFCGDLILGQGSSIVPPASGGGSLADHMGSLDRVEALGAELLCPGHGPWITDPTAKIIEYREHRLDRERKLVAALESGERDRERLLDAAWSDVAAPMRPVAALALQAHLEKLAAEPRSKS